ncbi:MAG: Gfo/Idh/MocA family oxidoreductase [Acidobacteriota bacterium]|nr:MAG: Gfo/Idh/MocA family oxidoreductase [Acidobacteriota bacterium]
MAKKVRWGVLGAAKIAVEKVIPAMQAGELSEITAIASRDEEKAARAARKLNIPQAYGSYEELLLDPSIDAVYNPLPNHLHVPWTIRAIEAGKHVLCEKPLGLDAPEAQTLIEFRDRYRVKLQEAFMVWTHPQWVEVRRRVQAGEIGEIRAIQGVFSYFNRDPKNVRNIPDYGGGGVMDIGCYPIVTSRFVLDSEPERVIALVEYDPDFQTDRLASAILDFGDVQSSFICSTQLVAYQKMHFFGTEGHIEVEIPFNAPTDRPCRVFIDRGDRFGRDRETLELPTCDQYTIQGDLFSRAILEDTEPMLPLESSLRNMAVIDAVLRSGETGTWQKPSFEI